jgi:hypothetical protein
VSKTRKGIQACVGALGIETGDSLRLFERDGSYPPANTPYQVGQVWELTWKHDKRRKPPHNETVIVYQRLLSHSIPPAELGEYLQNEIGIVVWEGSPDDLFDGYPNSTRAGKGYVSENTRLPTVSTGFWVSDKDIILVKDEYGSDCYEYQGDSRIRLLKYVGYDTPVGIIPAGTLIRVSLATWWCPSSWVDGEERCYLQLSGWYI